MNLFYIAARIAGKPMLMMREMGYDPSLLVYNAEVILNGTVHYSEVNRKVNEAILRAWEKAGFKTDPSMMERLEVFESRTMIHELEHLILDPSFSLGNGGSSAKRSLVESLMEEALSLGMGAVDEETVDIVVSGSYNWLKLKDDMSVEDLISVLAEATVSSVDRKTIRDSVVRILRTKFSDRNHDAISVKIGKDSEKFGFRPGLEIYHAILYDFVLGVANKYEDYKQILDEEIEEKWRKFNLHLKNEIKKIVPKDRSTDVFQKTTLES